MWCCRPSGEWRRTRGMTLIEVTLSQTLALILITAMSSLVVDMIKKLNTQTNDSDASVRLREASHLILRDTQGVGGEISQNGDILIVDDGGLTGADAFSLFKRDEAICGGGVTGTLTLAKDKVTGVAIAKRGISAACPLLDGSCTPKEIATRRTMVMAGQRSVDFIGQTLSSSDCSFTFPTTSEGVKLVDRYNRKYGTPCNGKLCVSVDEVLADLRVQGGGAVQLLFGSSFNYRVDGESLQRSVDGVTFSTVVDSIFDMQVERLYDIDNNGTIDVKEVITVDTGVAVPAGASEDTVLGIRIGVIAFGKTTESRDVLPPATFSNRSHTSVTKGRTYRGTFVMASARNRSGI